MEILSVHAGGNVDGEHSSLVNDFFGLWHFLLFVCVVFTPKILCAFVGGRGVLGWRYFKHHVGCRGLRPNNMSTPCHSVSSILLSPAVLGISFSHQLIPSGGPKGVLMGLTPFLGPVHSLQSCSPAI